MVENQTKKQPSKNPETQREKEEGEKASKRCLAEAARKEEKKETQVSFFSLLYVKLFIFLLPVLFVGKNISTLLEDVSVLL
jgi:hypothetical protein